MVEPQAQTAVRNVVEIENLSISYSGKPALSGVNLEVRENEIFGIIGPANSGKTSFLKALNRMDQFNTNMNVQGTVRFMGRDVREWKNLYALRQQIGVVFPLPVGLPLSVYDNVALSPRLRGIKDKARLDEIVERCLTRAALWDEVKDRLDALGSLLSGGQQQRLTIARDIVSGPYSAGAGRVFDCRRPCHDDAHRRRPQGTTAGSNHHHGHQPGAAGPAPRGPHCLFPKRSLHRNRRNRGPVYRQRQERTHQRLHRR